MNRNGRPLPNTSTGPFVWFLAHGEKSFTPIPAAPPGFPKISLRISATSPRFRVILPRKESDREECRSSGCIDLADRSRLSDRKVSRKTGKLSRFFRSKRISPTLTFDHG